MLLTLSGRLQTRIAVLAVIGGLVTLAVTPLVTASYTAAYCILAAVIVIGLGWELVYHLLQQFRWEKDWPTLFALLNGINEGVLLWFLIDAGLIPNTTGVTAAPFSILFAAVWLSTWLWNNGPMRVPLVHWRFRGGRLI
ncbi:hypothetical protein [Kineosporia sp. NBRC 101731]|uniref:hypothetical protein n=1 Tax=Kineosporia sp. NBRC 101731 TaxID=3032199 RepID=UPI0024A59E97|nr:hypothetical protein [Kineosporia sp. NBRC 101731]GLY31784.1 hypothetical protein Kisp02_51490 [Kineosporia sp. NBRC 101731]